jgi:S1-C subfamily serine protease
VRRDSLASIAVGMIQLGMGQMAVSIARQLAMQGAGAAAIAAAALMSGMVPAHAADTQSGSGVVIGARGEILTNAHVIRNCSQFTVRSASGDSAPALLVERDEKNDLAVVRRTVPLSAVAVFRDGGPVRAGDAVVALGYPLSGLLAKSANLTVGNVSALAGLRDDSRYLQISAPVQPGNSGGPLLDASGHLVGIVTSKLNAAQVARFTGDIPQNVNFALKAEVARTFLDSKNIAYQTARSDRQLSAADVGDIARPFTVQIECHPVDQSDQRVDSQTISAGAQRAVLYEEDRSSPQGRTFVGSAAWRTETVSPGPGHPSELAARADIKIPERGMVATLSLRRNSDPSLTASHVIEIKFTLPSNFRGGGIASVPGFLAKESEVSRGKPLTGLAVKVTDGFFMFGLSAVDADRQRNLLLLKDQEWFDIPIYYGNGERAILAVQKGQTGARIFTDAFAAWGQ